MSKSNGFTLIEVLIAMLILAGGLLGLAGLQATSLKNNQSAYNRSQASLLAHDIAERIRANKQAISTYTSISPTNALAKSSCLTTNGCGTTDLAENDLYEWNIAIAQSLPAGVGTISEVSGIYSLTLSWDDDHDGNDSNNPSFITSFQP